MLTGHIRKPSSAKISKVRKMKERIITITVQTFESKNDLSADDARLVQAAMDTCTTSYAPYSNFSVGAAVLLENGQIVCGSNQENIAYPSGLCAERIALLYANSHYPDVPVKAIAVSSASKGVPNEQPVYPCGACRQVLLQVELRYGKAMKVIMAGTNSIKMVGSAKDLLPLSFDAIP